VFEQTTPAEGAAFVQRYLGERFVAMIQGLRGGGTSSFVAVEEIKDDVALIAESCGSASHLEQLAMQRTQVQVCAFLKRPVNQVL
jgi:hypothetical protein